MKKLDTWEVKEGNPFKRRGWCFLT